MTWYIDQSPVARSIPFDNTGTTYIADNVQDGLEEAKLYSEGFPRAGVRSIYNGTVGNNDWLGPNELTSNTPLLSPPVALKINEISWSNKNTSVDFTITFYKNGKTSGDIVYQLVVSNGGISGYTTNVNISLVAGDVLWALYTDQGTNLSDADLILWVSRTSL